MKNIRNLNYLKLVLDMLLLPPISFRQRLDKRCIPNPELHPLMRRRNPVRRQINSCDQVLRRGGHHSPEDIAEDICHGDAAGLARNEVERAGEEEEGDPLSVLPERRGAGFEFGRLLSQRGDPIVDAEGWFLFLGLRRGLGVFGWFRGVRVFAQGGPVVCGFRLLVPGSSGTCGGHEDVVGRAGGHGEWRGGGERWEFEGVGGERGGFEGGFWAVERGEEAERREKWRLPQHHKVGRSMEGEERNRRAFSLYSQGCSWAGPGRAGAEFDCGI